MDGILLFAHLNATTPWWFNVIGLLPACCATGEINSKLSPPVQKSFLGFLNFSRTGEAESRTRYTNSCARSFQITRQSIEISLSLENQSYILVCKEPQHFVTVVC